MKAILIKFYESQQPVRWSSAPNDVSFYGQVLEVGEDYVQFSIIDEETGETEGRPYVRICDVFWLDPENLVSKKLELERAFEGLGEEE